MYGVAAPVSMRVERHREICISDILVMIIYSMMYLILHADERLMSMVLHVQYQACECIIFIRKNKRWISYLSSPLDITRLYSRHINPPPFSFKN